MLKPREVYNDPHKYWAFITTPNDDDMEGQYFERKQFGGADKMPKHVQKTVSAFANSNKEGGVLILGVANNGEVTGVSNIPEKTRNGATNINVLLKNHAAIVSAFDCTNKDGKPDQIILIYSGYMPNAICESIDDPPKAWMRSSTQSNIMTNDVRKHIEREKGILDFEKTKCCLYREEEVDVEVVEQFRASISRNIEDTRELLYQVGALTREGDEYYFNNAGFLFFSSNPQRILNYAHIRLARFEVEVKDFHDRGLPTNEKKFDGALPRQILKTRAYFEESGFFKVYQRRNDGGGFTADPEFPTNVIDEAIVNGIAHRDYAINLPIECFYYKDAFCIKNSGRIRQREGDVPERFTLEEKTLVSTPRNSLIVEWLKDMKDDKGASFVQKLGEGTANMKREMEVAGLPSPIYRTTFKETTLTLYNNYIEREALITSIKTTVNSNRTEFLNLFKLSFFTGNGIEKLSSELDFDSKEILVILKNKLEANNWYIDKMRFGRIKAHKRKSQVALDSSLKKNLMIFPAYDFQVRRYFGYYYLVVDYAVEVKNIKRLSEISIAASDVINLRADVMNDNGWGKAKIISVVENTATVEFFDTKVQEQVTTHDVIPDLPNSLLSKVLGTNSNSLTKVVKRIGLTTSKNAARTRIDKTLSVALELSKTIFPLSLKGNRISMDRRAFEVESDGRFPLIHLDEPKVKFRNQRETTDIRQGITSFGSFDSNSKNIEVIPVCIDGYKEHMESLIRRLQIGKYRYKGTEKTFNTRIHYNTIHTVGGAENILPECKRLIENYPAWVGDENLERIFIVQIPDSESQRDNYSSAYFEVKNFLFTNGIPCQMISTSTLHNADWKDLNLALNVVAKCGVTPWVLPDKIPDADFFIGLSYTQARNYKKGMPRLMGYANVINSFGKWEFFSGKTETFAFEEKTKYFADLTVDILKRLDNRLSDSPNIHFHYSSRFKREDIETIVKAAQTVRPNGTFTFVSINFQHLLRLYDDKPETDGSLSRGSYVELGKNQLLLSTTGFNQYGKTLGTPKPLEATVWVYSGTSRKEVDLKSIAVQLLNLTKLNWASTSSISTEPITIKYAGNIAYLTFAFLNSRGEEFKLHPVLENTPWFL